MRYLAILLLSVGMLSCGKDDNPVGPQSGNEIWPLEVGNYWVYETGELVDEEYVVDTLEFSVARDTLIEGERWFKLALNGVEGGELDWCVNRSDGFWEKDPTEQLIWKYPAQMGDQYEIPIGTVTVENDSDTVRVWAGEFCCISYLIASWGGDNYELAKLSPGVGLVWMNIWNEANIITGAARLLSYEVQ